MMDKFDELLEKLNGLNIIQFSFDWAEDIPEELWEEYFENKYECVVTGLEVDKHRWYETSVTVIKINGRFMGIRSITDVFSEQMMCSDCYETIQFFEMKEISTITYQKIK